MSLAGDSAPLEVEAKYRIPTPRGRRILQSLLGRGLPGVQIVPATVRSFRDVYWDTDHRELLGKAIACRVRKSRGRLEAAVKRLAPPHGAVHVREEIEARVDSPAPWTWPAKLAAHIPVNPDRLRTLVAYRQKRRPYVVRQGDRAVLEISLDTVIVPAAGPLLRRRRFFALEIEVLADGGGEILQQVCSLLLKGCILRRCVLDEEPLSKLERVLELLEMRPGG